MWCVKKTNEMIRPQSCCRMREILKEVPSMFKEITPPGYFVLSLDEFAGPRSYI